MGKTLRLVLVAASALAAGAATLDPAHAQDLPEPGDGFTWERVGDVAIDTDDLAFGPDSTLWATGSDGPHRLDLSEGFPGVWDLRGSERSLTAILPLGRGPIGDTLVANTGGSTRRSVDGGQTWEVVYDEGEDGLYEVPAGYPFAGRLLTGDITGLVGAIAYSDDRGASFTPSAVPGQPGAYAGADDFVALPPGSDHPGRILAAGAWGVNVSDDGGATFRESGLWQAVYYVGEAVDAVERVGLATLAGGEVDAILGGRVSGQANTRVWSSADDGETWLPDGGGHQLLESPPYYPEGGARAVIALGDSSVLVMLAFGTIYRSDDAGETWRPVGRPPDVSNFVRATSAVLGPDRRLYVGLAEAGPARAWVYRTQETHEPKPVASEPVPEPEESLGVEVAPNPSRGTATVTVSLPLAGEAEASVYDVLGRRVALLHEGMLSAGRHELPIEAGALSPGVYVVRVLGGGAVAARAVTMLR